MPSSGMALRVSIRHCDYSQSFINLHKMCDRATPESILKYKLALSLHKLYNKDYNSIEGGVAWSSGQHRRLPLQGSKVRNSAVATSFFGNVNVPRANSSEEMRVRNRWSISREERREREQKRERQRVVSKVERSIQKKGDGSIERSRLNG